MTEPWVTENFSDRLASAEIETMPQETPTVAEARVSFLRWMVEGLRASLLLRPRIALDAVPGPWKLAFLVLIANLIDVAMDRLSLPDEVQFNYQGWLGQWSLCLITLWWAWCLMPRAQMGALPALGRAVAWFALQTWAALLPLVAYYGVMYWIKVADDQSVPAWVDDLSMSLVAVVWMFAVFCKLARVYFGGWLRAFVLTVGLFVIVIAAFSRTDAETWLATPDEAAQVEVVPGEDDSDDGNDDGDDTPDSSESQWMEAARRTLEVV
ncbi:hypothetical protein [Diaphorobacter aerolatus]|uniref:YIP1 family protein n=1 Tax=Diaphorobacter aerolatus TaxID=1288495 RepID=A0A7H0GHX3_9BURK|nr:hypothetical protein [Diaphorobacter aerolatus]QNP47889.1 hypothetical protein H9K75_17415 [Diaphorobacter aerolatus]